MGKYVIGLFFLLIAIFLVVYTQNNTVPEVEDVGKSITEEIKDVYKTTDSFGR